MENMRKLSAFLMLFILIGVLAAVPMAASAKEHPIKEKVFITYGTGAGAYTDEYDVFSYDGLHWWDGPRTSGIPATGIKYYVNPSGAPSGAIGAVKTSFETWDAQVTVELFNDAVEQISKVAGNRYDGKNVVSWGALRPGIVAVTYIWYYSDSLEIVEFGIVFNKLYAWGIGVATAFDVQNVATHEAGHTLSLNDLYMNEACELTMYGYASIGETKKQSLGLGDINGVQYIYGA
jgi:hypothetical protein